MTLGTGGEINTRGTATLMEDGDPWVGLKRFHRVMLDWIAQKRVRERAVRHGRLESSSLRDESMVASALARLTKLARPEASIPLAETRDQVLFLACRAVGVAAGIEIKEPPYDAEGQPLRLIARASGFWTRRVRLDRGWWTSDGGPLLGSLLDSGRPVALIPSSRSSYLLVDPTATADPVVVTAEVAKQLGPKRRCFTRRCLGQGQAWATSSGSR